MIRTHKSNLHKNTLRRGFEKIVKRFHIILPQHWQLISFWTTTATYVSSKLIESKKKKEFSNLLYLWNGNKFRVSITMIMKSKTFFKKTEDYLFIFVFNKSHFYLNK